MQFKLRKNKEKHHIKNYNHHQNLDFRFLWCTIYDRITINHKFLSFIIIIIIDFPHFWATKNTQKSPSAINSKQKTKITITQFRKEKENRKRNKGYKRKEREKRGKLPETKRLVLGSGLSRAWAAGGVWGMKLALEIVEKSRLKPRGAATAALRAITLLGFKLKPCLWVCEREMRENQVNLQK